MALDRDPLPAAGAGKLEAHPPVGQGRRDVAEDGIDQLLDPQAGDPGISGSLAHGEPNACAELFAAHHVGEDAQPEPIDANGVGIEPQPRSQVFKRVGDVESVGDRRHEKASRG